ncbi:mdis1-interacting receptor like kinase 2 [Nicotiana attenuata]|uniref:non-specific serine/threonine protein kinase n=1 Tax=Nicotiana attenuata TaxID=49451 RepID=A0A1J6KMY4_NICAT|nr:mdis1-interacting receptor like kinase 2 [Nicotiana attenuata]
MMMLPRILFSLLQFFTLLYLFTVSFASTGEATDLLKWKATFQNQNNTLLASWKLSPVGSKNSSSAGATGSDACRGWYGVTCLNGRVNRLNITNASVVGTLYDFPFSPLPFLECVDLSMNQLSGTIPPEIGKLTNLVYLDLSINQISGTIPPEIGSLTKLDETLSIFDNQLNGSIPEEIGHLRSLAQLALNNNYLSGSIPALLGNLNNLSSLYLCKNKLSGPIPVEIGKMKSLESLYFDTNNLSGPIPSELGNLKYLTHLALYNNTLTGLIPTTLGDITELKTLYLYFNQLSGLIPTELGNLKNLADLDLSKNQLTGPIPNTIDGELPSQLASLLDLEKLNLSHNGLSGRIPEEFEIMKGLRDVVLSYNELECPIPNNKAFMNASFEGNKGLCGNVTGFQPCERPSSMVKKNSRSKLILAIVLPVMGALVLLCAFTSVRMCDKRRKVKDVERRDDGLFSISLLDGKALYRDILNAAEEFDATFFVGQGGQGSVYKVNLPSLGSIAVKRFHSSFANTHCKSFTNEVNALIGIKHRNVVKLYGFCSNAQHPFLVYEYVERGSLFSILSNEVESKNLDWLKRVNIIKAVAFA